MVYQIFRELRVQRRYTELRDHETLPEKVWLYPEEGVGAGVVQQSLAPEDALVVTPTLPHPRSGGTRRHKTVGRVVPTREGEVVVEGTFRGHQDGDFRLVLTSAALTPADHRLGYLMTGSLERGDRKLGRWQTTHLAVTKRSGFS